MKVFVAKVQKASTYLIVRRESSGGKRCSQKRSQEIDISRYEVYAKLQLHCITH
jgi:hypothetical protein